MQKDKFDFTDKQITFAGFFYLLKEDAVSSALKELVLANFNLLETKAAEHLNYILQPKEKSDVLIDFHLQFLEKGIVAKFFYYGDPGSAFEELAQKIEASSLLGTSTIFVSSEVDAKESLSNKHNARKILSSSTNEGTLSFFELEKKRYHLYLFEPADAKAKVSQIKSPEFVALDWAFHKLQREHDYFSERIGSIHKERIEAEHKLSAILHDQTGKSKSVLERIDFLEDQLTSLAEMYSFMATDMHQVRQALVALRVDLQEFIKASEKITKVSAANGFPYPYIYDYQKWFGEVEQQEHDLKMTLGNIKAAIDLAGSQVELLRGSEALELQTQTKELLNQNMLLQQEKFTLQTAAGLIELVLIFYYVLKSWEAVAPVESVHNLPSLAKLAVVAMFSVGVVNLTHDLASWRISHHKKNWLKFSLSLIMVLVSFSLMFALPIIYKARVLH